MNKRQHPIQPILRDDQGVVRFKANAIVRFLLDFSQGKGVGLNELAMMPFSDEDRTQFAQLIGYSVSGAGDLSYFDERVLAQVDKRAAAWFDKSKDEK